MKSKLLLVIDKEGWALDNIAKQLKKNLSDYYDIDILPSEILDDNIIKILILSKEYDLVRFFWRGHLSWIKYENSQQYIKEMGINTEEFIREFISNNNITTSVYDHMYLNDSDLDFTRFVIECSKSYTVSSKKLKDIYENISEIKKPKMVIQDGVDLDLFKPDKLERFKSIENKILRIGWVGNSKFTDTENDDDLKGVHKILVPAIEELKKEGYAIEEKFADRNNKMIPHNEMPNYYNSIDLYICTSKTEGTPNPVLESMACGVPVISTDVGIVPEAFGEKQKKFILEERTKQCLKENIIKIINNKSILAELSKENLEQIKKWDWEEMSKKFKNFFDENLKNGEIKNA